MLQQAGEHVPRSNPSKVAAADLNLIKGNKKHKSNVYVIPVYYSIQMWVNILI